MSGLTLTLPAQPRTMAHTFALTPLRAHFSKTPNPAGADRLIDLPGDIFLDTDDEIHVIAGALWTLSVKYDKLEEKDRPKDVDGLRKVSVVGRSARSVLGSPRVVLGSYSSRGPVAVCGSRVPGTDDQDHANASDGPVDHEAQDRSGREAREQGRAAVQ